jgi:NUMOD4 motif/HNH endonuclease
MKMSDIEIWKTIKGYENYEISNYGRVKSLNYLRTKKERIIKLGLADDEKYFIAFIYSGKKRCGKQVHVLVLEHFVGPKPLGMQACHNDGNSKNNYYKNLRWDTPTNNVLDRVKHGTLKLTHENIDYIRKNPLKLSQCKLAAKFKVNQSQISRVINRRIWNYLEEN